MLDIASYGVYETRTFKQIFPTQSEFVTYYNNCGIPALLVGQTVGGVLDKDYNVKTLYNLLLAEYMDSSIASKNETQFKLKVMKIIFEYGPTWEKRLKIQANLRALTDDDIRKGTQQVYNLGTNPGTKVSNGQITPIDGLNQQTISTVVRSSLDAYGLLEELVKADVTQEFLGKFKKLFIKFTSSYNPVLYNEEGDITNDF